LPGRGKATGAVNLFIDLFINIKRYPGSITYFYEGVLINNAAFYLINFQLVNT